MSGELDTLEGAVARYGQMAVDRYPDASGTRSHQVSCGGLGLADLLGYPDAADIPDDSREWRLIRLFGEEAAGRDIGESYARAVRRIQNEDVPPSTATGMVLTVWP